MFQVELAPLGGILGPLKSDLGVFWAKIPLYPYNVKTQKNAFSQNPLIARFWASGFWMSILSSANFKKDPPWNIFFSHSMLLPLVAISHVTPYDSAVRLGWINDFHRTQVKTLLMNTILLLMFMFMFQFNINVFYYWYWSVVPLAISFFLHKLWQYIEIMLPLTFWEFLH